MDRPGGTNVAVELDAVGHLVLLSYPGSVDHDNGLAVFLEPNIYSIPGCPRRFADDHPLGTDHGVDKRALAGVSLADYRYLHNRLGDLAGLKRGEPLEDFIEQNSLVEIVLCRDAQEFSETQPGELPGCGEQSCRVGLIGDTDDVEIPLSQKLCDCFVQRHDAIANVDHKQHKIGRFDRLVDLLLDMVAQPVAVDYSVSAGVDELEVAVVPANYGADTVPCDAGCRLDDTYHLSRQRI